MPGTAVAAAGFTLVELLVVIGIIALLISVLLPALNRAKQAAVKTQCLSQVRQISLAMQFYANDNKGWFPSRNEMGTQNSIAGGWPNEMRRASNYRYDLNYTFIIPYVAGNTAIKKISRAEYYLDPAPYLAYRNKIMFCPGQINAIYPTPGSSMEEMFCSYQYHVFTGKSYWKTYADTSVTPTVNKTIWVDLSRRHRIKGLAPLWSCHTQMELATNMTSAGHLGKHSGPPKGLNSAFSDGSARWVEGDEIEPYYRAWNGTSESYWPKYRRP